MFGLTQTSKTLELPLKFTVRRDGTKIETRS